MSLLAEAAEYVIGHQYGSANAVQRKLRVGFAKAGQLMDQLETLGIVGPHRGAAPRDVLVPASGLQDALDRIEGNWP